MLKVKVITIGRCKEAWLSQALSEYENRLKSRLQIEWILVEQREALIEKTLKEPRFIALDLKGEPMTSEQLSKNLFTKWGSRIVFVIGGAEGLPSQIIERASFLWCLSSLTFTHQIVRLLLVEQLYRAIEIERGSSYHK